MKTACKSTNIRVELARLQVMELHELREKWRELYGKDAPDCGKVFLLMQLAFRIQELRFGENRGNAKGSAESRRRDSRNSV